MTDLNALIGCDAYREVALKYPHIAVRMRELWPDEDFALYMHTLFTDTRDGERSGFPPADFLRLVEINNLYITLYAKHRKEAIWHYRI